MIINSIPKSGSHLLLEFLKKNGYTEVNGELISNYFSDRNYVYYDEHEKRRCGPAPRIRSMSELPIPHTKRWFLRAHMKHDSDINMGEDTIFVYRHPRNTLVSWIRWMCIGGEWRKNVLGEPSADLVRKKMLQHLDHMIKMIETSYKWKDQAFLPVKFEDMIDEPVSTFSYISNKLNIDYHEPNDVLFTDTPTWSGNLSNWKNFWNTEIDEKWEEMKGHELEKEMGYKNE